MVRSVRKRPDERTQTVRNTLPALILLALAGQAKAAVLPPPAPVPPVPHVDTVDAGKAAEVKSALAAVYTSQGLAPAATYDVPSLSCQLLTVPFEPETYSCGLDVVTADGARKTLQVQDDQHSSLAQTLFGALQNAGASYLNDPHYFRTTLANLKVTDDAVRFDDKSKYVAPPVPNVRVTGETAGQLLDAIGALGLDDSDRTLFLICSDWGAVECSYQLHNRPGQKLSGDQATALWNAIKGAATVAGFKPYRGTVDDLTIVNVSALSYDGTTLGFVLVGDDSTPPPPPSTHH